MHKNRKTAAILQRSSIGHVTEMCSKAHIVLIISFERLLRSSLRAEAVSARPAAGRTSNELCCTLWYRTCILREIGIYIVVEIEIDIEVNWMEIDMK